MLETRLPREVVYPRSFRPTPSHPPSTHSYRHIYLNIPGADLRCFNLSPLINIHTVVTARWSCKQIKKKVSPLRERNIDVFSYVIIKASPSPPISFTVLFMVHVEARLQRTPPSSYRPRYFLVLGRREMLPGYIKQEFTAALKFPSLEDPFK